VRDLIPDLAIIPFSLWKKRQAAIASLTQGHRSRELSVNFDRQIKPFIKKGRNVPDQCEIKINFLNNLPYAWDEDRQPCYYKYLACLFDASRYFVLAYEANTSRFGVAVLGFELKRSCFRIVQIQGLDCGDSPEIMAFIASLKWERLLVSFAENWAKDNGFHSKDKTSPP